MRLLPYERFHTESRLPPDELLRRLAWQVDAPKWIRWPWDSSDKPFEGRMEGGHFIVWTLLKFQTNSFRPVVAGTVEPHPGGSIIRAVIRFHWFVYVAMATWISIALVAAIQIAAQQARAGRLELGFLVPSAFAVVGYLFSMVFFWLGARRAKRVLVEVARS